ncbi:MAG: vitamin K epoxide reductase family protein [Myxococcota bacterium]|nr:vitamin K epoxide reductase family protein [Myxococcota bacterium]
MRAKPTIAIAALAAALGFAFAAVSTHDFVQHLDRQVHGLHCSFLPGLDQTDVSGASGCHVTLMSPYSSVLRETVWGGIPISLPAMAVFAFLAALAVGLFAMGRARDPRAMGFQALAWALPVIASAVMGYISLSTLGAACKLCIGIYVASGLGFIAALAGFLLARADAKPRAIPVEADETVESPPPVVPTRWGVLGAAFGLGVAFVLVPVGVYAAAAPDFERYVGSCGQLADPSDPNEVLLPIGAQTNPVPVIEVLDPLCPACRGFEARFEASSAQAQASRKVLLFPLDDSCNWMIDRAIHPGACAISEAVVCAEGEAEDVIAWAFENQEAIMAAEREAAGGAARMARERFGALADCIGSPRAQARVNQSLRWAVQNQLPVLTPQVYVGQTRLCDADTDLGMDYALTRLMAQHGSAR